MSLPLNMTRMSSGLGYLLLAGLLFMIPHFAVATPSDSLDVDLSQHNWEHRLVLVFAPSEDDSDLADQMTLWRGEREGFVERKLRIYRVVGTRGGRMYRHPGEDGRPITGASAQALRKRFDVSRDAFSVILVGLDGAEKRREPEPIKTEDLFATIDAMPMRRAEMRKEENGGG